MDFGAVLLTQYPAGRDPEACMGALSKQARVVEDVGFDSLWVTEHHFVEDGFCFDNVQVLSSLASETDEIGLGTAVWLLPLHNVAETAERVANLDVASGGRFTFGVGAGYREKEFEVFGVDRSKRAGLMFDGVASVKRLLTQDSVDFEGREVSLNDVTVSPKPIQDPHPRIWIGGPSPTAIRHAAEAADAWLPSPTYPVSKLHKQYETYDEACEDADEQPTARPLMREVFVGETTDEALRTVREPILDKYARYRAWDNENVQDDDDRFEALRDELLIVGGPDDVVEEIQWYEEAFDIDHLIVRSQWPTMPHEDANRSLRLFAEEVIPSFS